MKTTEVTIHLSDAEIRWANERADLNGGWLVTRSLSRKIADALPLEPIKQGDTVRLNRHQPRVEDAGWGEVLMTYGDRAWVRWFDQTTPLTYALQVLEVKR